MEYRLILLNPKNDYFIKTFQLRYDNLFDYGKMFKFAREKGGRGGGRYECVPLRRD